MTFLELYEDGAFRAVAVRRRVHPNDVDDVVQDAAIKCCVRQRACREGSQTAYLWQAIATSQADNRRRAARFPPITEIREGDRPVFTVHSPRGHNKSSSVDARADVPTFLRQLPPKEREAVQKYYLDGLSFGEIAAAEGVPEQTVRRRSSRGIKTLRKIVGHDSD